MDYSSADFYLLKILVITSDGNDNNTSLLAAHLVQIWTIYELQFSNIDWFW